MKEPRSNSLPARSAVDDFLAAANQSPVRVTSASAGRLIFAMDATASREQAWDQASTLQTEMFVEAARYGELAVKLCFYRGFRELRASPWINRSEELVTLMDRTRCAAGQTQLGRVLTHVRREHAKHRINAVVFVGDAFEEELDSVAAQAGALGAAGCRVFMFQEGQDPIAQHAFKTISRMTGGAYSRFDANSAERLRSLLGAVAAYAAGGESALKQLEDRDIKARQLRLSEQLGSSNQR
jgi:hypothetical protein